MLHNPLQAGAAAGPTKKQPAVRRAALIFLCFAFLCLRFLFSEVSSQGAGVVCGSGVTVSDAGAAVSGAGVSTAGFSASRVFLSTSPEA